MRTKQQFLLLVLGFSVSLFSAPASAVIQWTLNTGLTCSGGANFGNSCQKTTDGVQVNARAYSTTLNTANTALETAYLGVYGGSGGGLGVTNRDGAVATSNCGTGKDCGEGTIANTTPPEHALDTNGRTDSILFTFSSLIKLTALSIGYPGSNSSGIDSDLTILAYTSADVPNLNGDTYQGASGLTTQGWKLVGQYSNVADAPNNTVTVNSAGLYSQYWLVAGYTPSFGGPGNWSIGDDYAKILTLSGGKTTNVSEPNTLLLIGVGAIAGIWGRRRRQVAR
ncbi:MAG: PEP-CTERM sorting domain-containing protein [Prolixibacteraceae bacterium]|nr:PEP-CTERM sorting domain-containing protein [Burkholderiales bacterium]